MLFISQNLNVSWLQVLWSHADVADERTSGGGGGGRGEGGGVGESTFTNLTSDNGSRGRGRGENRRQRRVSIQSQTNINKLIHLSSLPVTVLPCYNYLHHEKMYQ